MKKITMFHIEAALFMPYDTVKEGVKTAFERAIEE
jgi:hypothetical protein